MPEWSPGQEICEDAGFGGGRQRASQLSLLDRPTVAAILAPHVWARIPRARVRIYCVSSTLIAYTCTGWTRFFTWIGSSRTAAMWSFTSRYVDSLRWTSPP